MFEPCVNFLITAEKDGGIIPGAKHIHFKDLFKEKDGTIKDDDELKSSKYSQGLHRLEKYLNFEGFLEKSLKI